MAFEILDRIEALSPANLTIREQTRLAENPLDLRFPALAPEVPAESIKLSDISTVDHRPVGGRREWNADGREISEKIGVQKNFEIVPINPTHHIDERRMQILRERSQGVRNLVDKGIIKDADTWPTFLADAAERQVERDFFEAWATNTLTVMDPKAGTTVTVSMGYAAARYVTEAPIVSDPTVNAYTRLMYHIGEAQRLMGSVGAVRMRRASASVILGDAPVGSAAGPLTFVEMNTRLGQEGFGSVQIVIDERTYDAPTDGGSASAAAYYVPTNRWLFQPVGGRIGSTHVAPVTRAYDFLSQSAIERGVANGVVTFRSPKNQGKTLLIEAQKNALSIPEEQFVYVVNAGA